jgi:hypothetical protein
MKTFPTLISGGKREKKNPRTQKQDDVSYDQMWISSNNHRIVTKGMFDRLQVSCIDTASGLKPHGCFSQSPVADEKQQSLNKMGPPNMVID